MGEPIPKTEPSPAQTPPPLRVVRLTSGTSHDAVGTGPACALLDAATLHVTGGV